MDEMNDLIRKRDAITSMSDLICNLHGKVPVFNEVYHAIDDIPPVDPEPNSGYWIYDTERVARNGGIYTQYHCSECDFQIIGSLFNYCPNCGADMRGK